MLLYRGAPAGPGTPGGGLARAGSVPQAFGIRLSTMSPRYLQSNSSSHTRPFSAIAELLDNAVDPDVCARTVFIDVEEVKKKPCLTFTDDGCGMTPHKLHRMLRYKVIKKSQCPIGVFGNGFKSGSMRLGKDALVFTKNGSTLAVGLLSQTYLECIQIINSEKDLLSQFDAIPGKKGTRVLIWNIRRVSPNKDGKSELDFDTDQYDILVSDFDAEEKVVGGVASELPETEYSLRAFCSILYMKPRMKIFLRQKKNKQVRITFGFSCKYHNQFGIMMYHNNRLIKAFEKVGCQLKPTCGEGVGVIGVIECNFLKPAYNKQDFEYTKEYRLTINALAQKLNAYWKEKISQENFETSPTSRVSPCSPGCPGTHSVDQAGGFLTRHGYNVMNVLSGGSFLERWIHPHYPQDGFVIIIPIQNTKRCSVPEEQERIDEDLHRSKAKQQLIEAVEKQQKPMGSDKLQVFSNPPKIPTPQDMAELNDKTIGYEQINSPSLLPSVREESRSPPRLKSLDSSAFQISRKYKLILGEEPVEKRRKIQNELSPIDYSMSSFYRRVESAATYPEGEKSPDQSSSERSTPPHLIPEYPESNKRAEESREAPALCPGSQDQDEGFLPPDGLEDQMPKLVAEESNRSSENVDKDMNKGPFVAVVGVAKGVADSGAPIQLVPFNREEFVGKRKRAESWKRANPYSSEAPAATAVKGKGCQESRSRNMPKIKNQKESEELKRTTEKLERVLAERNLFQQKVEELEQEKNHWHSEFKKAQHELVTYSTQETEGLYWSKKHMGYRQAEFQILKAELERTKEEKQELTEKLKETESHLEVLQKAQVSFRNPEGDDLERLITRV
ncbi:MORC family CW-type zinc finger protein 4 [Apodemus speciosus]|uniref:MORC family CW-type zinc finger protein 4 n=1 Tax=Apodemus speciosus TaxID=105296 RepID=A0ABQ0FVA2_APOSI